MPNKSYLRSITIDKQARIENAYPYNLPAIRAIQDLQFHPKVTFLVGENGSGKSTLVEAIAVAYGFNPEGGSRNFTFSTQSTHSSLYKHLVLTREPHLPKDGFFLRAESFYNFATAVDKVNESDGRSNFMKGYGGASLHDQSHGESFMSVLYNRFRGNGLYILDEPEAALSVQRQLELIGLLHQLTSQNSQLIIATHSPILLSYPDATIYHIDGDGIRAVSYEETDQYSTYKYFLNNYKDILKEILT